VVLSPGIERGQARALPRGASLHPRPRLLRSRHVLPILPTRSSAGPPSAQLLLLVVATGWDPGGPGAAERPVVLVPEVLGAGLAESVGEGADVGARRGGPVAGRRGRVGGAWEAGGADLGAEAGEVELLLVAEEAALLLPRQLLVHPLVLPLGQPARERARPAPHRRREKRRRRRRVYRSLAAWVFDGESNRPEREGRREGSRFPPSQGGGANAKASS
jgi:hypothetical protein